MCILQNCFKLLLCPYRTILLTKVDADEQKRLEEEKDQQEFQDLDAAVGFAKVIRKISESKKVVVGHNMLLDLCHTIQQFVAPLPEEYEEFKLLVNATLPKIVDTKLMASTSPLREEIANTSLEELLKTVSQAPFKLPKVESDDESSGYEMGDKAIEKYHEAGYDAFITGLCFIGKSLLIYQKMKNNYYFVLFFQHYPTDLEHSVLQQLTKLMYLQMTSSWLHL